MLAVAVPSKKNTEEIGGSFGLGGADFGRSKLPPILNSAAMQKNNTDRTMYFRPSSKGKSMTYKIVRNF